MTRFGAVERLRRDHEVEAFDCGKEALNRYLKRHAWANQQTEAARTYVVTAGASEAIGARALLVHAKDDEARVFYEHFGFERSPTDPLHRFLVMEELKLRIGS